MATPSLHAPRRRRASKQTAAVADSVTAGEYDDDDCQLARGFQQSLSLYDVRPLDKNRATRRRRKSSFTGAQKEQKEEDGDGGDSTEEEDNQPAAGTVAADAVPRFDFAALPPSSQPRALVLFAGAGFSSVGLALAGYAITAVELDEKKCYLHSFMKPAAEKIICADVRSLTPQFLQQYQTTWLSPPCQQRSVMRVSSKKVGAASERGFDFVNWCLENTRHCDVVWIENVYNTNTIAQDSEWAAQWNAAQFSPIPLQCRQRLVGGKYPMPRTFRKHHRSYRRVRGVRFEPVYKPGDYRPEQEDRPSSERYNEKLEYKAIITPSKREGRVLGIEPELCGVCPTLTSSEVKCPMKQYPDRQNPFFAYRQYGSRFYGCVRIRLDQMARHFGLEHGIPEDWRLPPQNHPEWGACVSGVAKWHEQLTEAIGNGVPIYMAFAFGQAALYATMDKSLHKHLQLDSRYVPHDKPFPKEWVDTRHKKALQYE